MNIHIRNWAEAIKPVIAVVWRKSYVPSRQGPCDAHKLITATLRLMTLKKGVATGLPTTRNLIRTHGVLVVARPHQKGSSVGGIQGPFAGCKL